MKIIKASGANFPQLSLIIYFLLIFGITSCSKDDAPDPVIKSSDKEITSFAFLLTANPIDVNVIGTIDEGAKTIVAEMPPGTDISGLLPEIEIPAGAEISPTKVQDFTNPVKYTVTAEDGSKVLYTATVTAALSQRDILQAILDANPENTTNWNLQSTADLNDLDGITTDVEGKIIELSLLNGNLTQLPPEIGLLINLKDLSLYSNQLTSIPPEIGQLTNLTKLRLSRNQLISIPPEIGKLTNLKDLSLDFNQLTSIPPEIGQLTNLTNLKLGYNQLTSLLPEIGKLTNLKDLSLYFNQLTSIPPEIGQLTNLTNLKLYNNQLISIPP